jgi:hypothetical protein
LNIYDILTTGALAQIKSRKAVYLYFASYGGGSGPLWAVEGERYQFTTVSRDEYVECTCISVSSSVVAVNITHDAHGALGSETLPIKDIRRFDQHHLPHEEEFVFQEEDIQLL